MLSGKHTSFITWLGWRNRGKGGIVTPLALRMGWDGSQEVARAQGWQGNTGRLFEVRSLRGALSPSAPGRQLSSTATRDPVLAPVHLTWSQRHPTPARPGVDSSEPGAQRAGTVPTQARGLPAPGSAAHSCASVRRRLPSRPECPRGP